MLMRVTSLGHDFCQLLRLLATVAARLEGQVVHVTRLGFVLGQRDFLQRALADWIGGDHPGRGDGTLPISYRSGGRKGCRCLRLRS